MYIEIQNLANIDCKNRISFKAEGVNLLVIYTLSNEFNTTYILHRCAIF